MSRAKIKMSICGYSQLEINKILGKFDLLGLFPGRDGGNLYFSALPIMEHLNGIGPLKPMENFQSQTL